MKTKKPKIFFSIVYFENISYSFLKANKTDHNVFKTDLTENRLEIISLFEIWQLAADRSIKNTIIELFNLCFTTDPAITNILYENTNLASELCCLIKEDIAKLGDY